MLKSFLSNFVDPSVLRQSCDITKINYQDSSAQLQDSELAIGTSTRMLLCGELEDQVVGSAVETRFYKSVRSFYKTAVSKIISKFPFNDATLKKLQVLDPRNRFTVATADVLDLAHQFTSFTNDDTDSLTMEYLDFCSCTDEELPPFDPKTNTAIDNFWANVEDITTVTDLNSLRFGKLAQLSKALLLLPHSNADPERLFSMVRNIYTEQTRQMDPTTLNSLLCVKINNGTPCFENKSLVMSESIIESATTAT